MRIQIESTDDCLLNTHEEVSLLTIIKAFICSKVLVSLSMAIMNPKTSGLFIASSSEIGVE